MIGKSFYHLRFAIEPGESHKDTRYVRGTLDKIKADLDNELADNKNRYLLLAYGAELRLDVYNQGESVGSYDLHPLVTVAIEGYPEITFDGETVTGYDFQTTDESSAEEGSLAGKLLNDQVTDALVTVAWTRLDVPELTGDIAGADDTVDADGEELPYGQTELDTGA
jgi:hypothetical protein